MTDIAHVQLARPDRSDIASISLWCRKVLALVPYSRPRDRFRREEVERSIKLTALRKETRRRADQLLFLR